MHPSYLPKNVKFEVTDRGYVWFSVSSENRMTCDIDQCRQVQSQKHLGNIVYRVNQAYFSDVR